DCFLRTYTAPRRSKAFGTEETLDCPLAELGLIRTVGDERVYRFHRGPQPNLPDGILFYTVLSFWDATAPGIKTFSLQDLARQPGSPGQLFKIDEEVFVERCDKLEWWTDGAIGFQDQAGHRLFYKRKPFPPLEVLARTYSFRTPVLGGPN